MGFLLLKNSNVNLIIINNQLELANLVRKSIYGEKIVIGMGAGSISSWMKQLPKFI